MTALNLLPDYVREKIKRVNDPACKSPPSIRDDLAAIPAAEAAGWSVKFIANHWHNGTMFSRNGVTVWWSGCWRAKTDAAPFWERVRTYPTLADALAAEGGRDETAGEGA